MSSFQFVLEDPLLRPQTKRPRLVTSCDNCRLKKIKCARAAEDRPCEACANAQVACSFRDRERYFAVRSNSMPAASMDFVRQGITPPPIGSCSSIPPLSEPRCPPTDYSPHVLQLRSDSTRDVLEQHSPSCPQLQRHPPCHYGKSVQTHMVSSYPGEPVDQVTRQCLNNIPYTSDTDHRSDRRIAPSDTAGEPSQHDSSTFTPLFDPRRPSHPHSTVLMQSIFSFFDKFGTSFPFLSYDEITRRLFERTLPPFLELAITAFAVPYLDVAKFTGKDAKDVVNTYCATAEAMLSIVFHSPSFDTLHALILLSLVEHKRNRSSTFFAYREIAVHMATEMGLDNVAVPTSQNLANHHMLQSTWASVCQLRLINTTDSRAVQKT